MIKFKTLRRRIFFILAWVIMVVAGSISWYLLYDLELRHYKTFQSVTKTINNTLVANIREYVYHNDQKNIQYAIDTIRSPYIENIIVLDTKGKVITSQKSERFSSHQFKAFSLLLNSQNHSIKNKHQHSILTTFELLDIPLGYLVVEGNIAYYRTEMERELLGLLIMIISFFILTLAIAFYLSKYITNPLYTIIETIKKTNNTEVLEFKAESEEEFKYLTETISFKHNELLKLNLELEEKIKEKTAELQQLNQNLEKEVEEAVSKVKLQEELFHKQARLAQMGEMISIIAHQWRQPLSAISSSMMLIDRHIETDKFLLKQSPSNQSFIEFLEKKHADIYNNLEYLSLTTDDFRKFFSPHSPKEYININQPIRKALKLIEKSITNNGIILDVKLQSKAFCKLYQNEIMQVILNLLKNATDALLEQHTKYKYLHILSYDKDKKIIVKVIDNGIGISKETEAQIFDPYFSTKVQKNGTGLGLYMSKNIIEEHNAGKLTYAKIHNNTCFIIEFSLENVT